MSNFSTPPKVVEQVAQLGQRIRTARIRRGWSVADLASKGVELRACPQALAILREAGIAEAQRLGMHVHGHVPATMRAMDAGRRVGTHPDEGNW